MKPIIVVGHAQSLTLTSWWVSAERANFTARAMRELDRMGRSKFARLVVLAQGPAVASAFEAARQRKVDAARSSSYSASAIAS